MLLPDIAPSLQLPEVPGVENWLWRSRSSFEAQLKAVPLHSVVPPPTMLHVNVSISPGQAQLTFAGTCSVSFAKSTNITILNINYS